MASFFDIVGAALDARVDDLDRLTERAMEAIVSGRTLLAATLFSRAENFSSQLHPDGHVPRARVATISPGCFARQASSAGKDGGKRDSKRRERL